MKIKKRILTTSLFVLVLLLAYSVVFADRAAKIQLMIDDKVIHYDEVKYGSIHMNNQGAVMLPLTLFADQLDWDVNYNQLADSVNIITYDKACKIAQNVEYRIDSIENKTDKIYLPLSFLTTSLNYNAKLVMNNGVLLVNSSDSNAKYYTKPTLEACGFYNQSADLIDDNGIDLYQSVKASNNGNPASPYYRSTKDERVLALNQKWLEKSDNRFGEGSYFSGFTIKDIGGANNIYVDFGRRDLSVVITRWNTSSNASPIFKDVLNLFLAHNKIIATEIYDDIANALNTGNKPVAAYRWRSVSENVRYRAEQLSFIDDGIAKNAVLVRVHLDYFWH